MDGLRPSALLAPSIWKAAVATPKMKSPGKRSASVFASIICKFPSLSVWMDRLGSDLAKPENKVQVQVRQQKTATLQ
ncbi:hypothetical protein RHECNPAF_580022 [Rhizobium etli CNPAF512]|nr:hypothetical protein RHECNPAF_580022 [Rhizobium etli CNPAF512]